MVWSRSHYQSTKSIELFMLPSEISLESLKSQFTNGLLRLWLEQSVSRFAGDLASLMGTTIELASRKNGHKRDAHSFTAHLGSDGVALVRVDLLAGSDSVL